MKRLTQHEIDCQVDIWNKKADKDFQENKITAEQYDLACLMITQWEEGHILLSSLQEESFE